MAVLLDIGDYTFLGVKVAIGIFVAIVFLRFGTDTRVGKYGLSFAIAVYAGVMGIHILTGLSAMGLLSDSTIERIGTLFAFIR